MSLIKKYCQRGMMVICTIHQPRAAIWNLFEKARGHEESARRVLLDGWTDGWFSCETYHHSTTNTLTPNVPNLANRNHDLQPRRRQVMVLSMGHQVYFGDASGAEAWFSTSLVRLNPTVWSPYSAVGTTRGCPMPL